MSQRQNRFGDGTCVASCAAAAVFLSMATATPALAQDAVEWTEAEGGNGHWYSKFNAPDGGGAFQNFENAAVSIGGHLVSVNSLEEEIFLAPFIEGASVEFGVLIGTQVPADCSSFAWTDGSEWGYTNWGANQPKCKTGDGIAYYPDGWHDVYDWHVDTYIVEWSADCNGDGIVDYGQIHDGSLTDGNGDGRPDVCDDYLHVPEQYATIAEAIDASSNGETILIEWGTYTPGQPLDTQGKAITIRGAGSDSESPSTIIDGQDSHRVLQCMSGEGADTVFENLMIRNGSAGDAGGLYAEGSSPTFINCRFESNRGTGGVGHWGGAIYANEGANLRLIGCDFVSNLASGDGGGVYSWKSDIVLENCTFTNNSATYEGGSIWVAHSGSAELTGCIFTGSSGRSAGAVGGQGANQGDVTLIISGCEFTNNTAANGWDGGGGVKAHYAHAEINNCTFTSNQASDGGGLCLILSTANLNECEFIGNVSTDYGGGLFANGGSCNIEDCVVTGNTSNNNGGGLFFEKEANATIVRTTISSNTSGTAGGISGYFANLEFNSCEMSGNDAGGGSAFRGWATDSIFNDCLIVNNSGQSTGPAVGNYQGGDCQIAGSAICDNSTSQIDGPWTDNGGNCITEVCEDNDGDGIPNCVDPCPEWPYDCSEDGQTLTVAVGQSIQDAIDVVPDGGTIEVAAGTFQPTATLDPGGKAFTLRGATDGFNGTPTTILDGQDTIRLLICQSGEDADTIFENLVITNGLADFGGGMLILDSSNPTLINCTFSYNTASEQGGGLRCVNNSPTLSDCLFTDNWSANHGGGIHLDCSSATLTNCDFLDNTASYGAGVSATGQCGDPTLTDCEFYGNAAVGPQGDGGGFYSTAGAPVLVNCVVSNNSATSRGGGLSSYSGSVISLSDTTVCGNSDDQLSASWDDLGGNCISEICDSDGDGIPDCIDPCPYWPYDCSEDGQTIYVGTGESIQLAIDGVPDGGTIEIEAGAFYPGAVLDTAGRAMTIRGAVDSLGEPASLIGGLDAHRVLQCLSGEGSDTVFENLWIRGGYDPNDGGGMMIEGSSPTLRNMIFELCNSETGGGVSCNANAAPAFEGCLFINNGAAVGGGVYSSTSSPRFLSCEFAGNTATSDIGVERGGGVYCRIGGTPEFDGCLFGNNVTGEWGGGLGIESCSPVIMNCVFTGNTAGELGGGIYSFGGGDPSLENTQVCGNAIDQVDGAYTDLGGNCITEICDSDGDETLDCFDNCPDDPNKTEPGDCGCGNPETDTDGDGVPDCVDICPGSDDNVDTDGDTIPDGCDPCPNWPYDCSEDGQTVYVAVGQSIQAAIDVVPDGGTIEIAAGTFQPGGTLDTGGQAMTIRGAVDGGGLSGAPTTIIDGQNAHRVLQCVNSEGPDTIFENLYITGGSATDGGGMFNDQSSPTLTNCAFEGNSATNSGGGMANNDSSSPTLTGCTFTENTAYQGGGMSNWGSGPTLMNCTFTNNSATLGGGIHNTDESSPTLTNCTFVGNLADSDDGGGMYNSSSSSPTLSDCAFEGNSASNRGGGMYNTDESSPTLENCIFEGNSADENGGGMYCYSSSPTLTNCTFTGNSANYYGGGMYNTDESSPTLTDCTFEGNSANFGGGMYNYGSSPTLENCTFEGNSAYDGGGMYNSSDSSPALNNCMFSQNSAGSSGFKSGEQDENVVPTDSGGGMYNSYSSPTLEYCTFEGNSAGGGGGGMYNNGSSPTLTGCTFTNNSADGYGGGMYNSSSSSPMLNGCIFTGNSADGYGGGMYNSSISSPALTDTTVCSNTPDQIDGGWTDNGGNCIQESCDDCGEDGNVTVPGDYDSITEAIAAAADGWIISVAPGTYNEAIDFAGKAITVEASGGFATTILDGTGLESSIVVMMNGEGPDSVLRGFTLQNGVHGTPFPLDTASYCGGAFFSYHASPTIEDCMFQNNSSGWGGAIYCYWETPTIRNCSFSLNHANVNGGAVLFGRPIDGVIDGCVVSNNSAVEKGGGMYAFGGSLSLVNSELSNNAAGSGGGVGWYTYDDEDDGFQILSSVIKDNTAEETGGGIWTRCPYRDTYVEVTEVCGNSPNEIHGAIFDLGDNTLCICLADFNNNGTVDGGDLGILLAYWDSEPTDPCFNEDLNGDGVVNGGDLGLLLSLWGPCPNP